jgi:superfamily II DNA helicase RecQ
MDHEDIASDDSFEDVPESEFLNLPISFHDAKSNYDMVGEEVPEEKDKISLDLYPHLFVDVVHVAIQEVLSEVQLPYSLSDFQLLSLHVLGSGKSLLLVSPTGSGKTIVIYLGTLLLRKMLKISEGVAVITEPLNMIMSEKLATSIVPTGVISMSGELRTSLEERDGVRLSAPEEKFLDGSLPCLFGHPESWLSEKGKELIKELHKKKRIVLNVTDEMHCCFDWANIR